MYILSVNRESNSREVLSITYSYEHTYNAPMLARGGHFYIFCFTYIILTTKYLGSVSEHPNCKLFITHGGHHSSIESIHFGVPVIGMPVLFDQKLNVNKAVATGYAIKVDLGYDAPAKLKEAINTMLTDQK